MNQTPTGLWNSFYHSWKASWASGWLTGTPSFIKSLLVTRGEENAQYSCVGEESQSQNGKESWLDLSPSVSFSWLWTSPIAPRFLHLPQPPFSLLGCLLYNPLKRTGRRWLGAAGWFIALQGPHETSQVDFFFPLCTFEKSNIVQKVNITSWHRSPKPRKNVSCEMFWQVTQFMSILVVLISPLPGHCYSLPPRVRCGEIILAGFHGDTEEK